VAVDARAFISNNPPMLLLLLLLLGPAGAPASLVTVSAHDAVAQLGAASEIDVPVEVAVADGFHVQANPASDEYLIATTLELAGQGGVEVLKIIYPKGKTFRLHGSDKDFAVYDGHFQIVAHLGVGKVKAAGRYELKGQLGYQACDARSCRPPTKAPFTVAVDVRLSSKPRKD
jgi:hypothetical protein